MGLFMNFLYSIDYFALTPGLYFKGRRKFRTPFGICLTLICAAAFIHIFVIFSLNMVTKSNPQVIFSEKHYRVPPKTVIDFRNFSVALAFSNVRADGEVEQVEYDPSIFYPVFSELRYTRINQEDSNFKYKVNITRIKMSPCKANDFKYDDQLLLYIKRVNSTNVVCVNLDQQVTLEGQPGEDFYTMLSLDLIPCTNSTENSLICKDPDIIREQISRMTVHIFATNIANDLVDYKNPLKKYIYTFNVDLTTTVAKVVEVRLKKTRLITDSAAIFSDEQLEEHVNLDTWIVDMRENRKHPAVLSIYFKMDNIIKEYKRTYDKFPDILAKFGGIAKSILIVLCLFSEPIVNFLYKRDLVKTLELEYEKSSKKFPSDQPQVTQRPSYNYLDVLKYITSLGFRKPLGIKSLFSKYRALIECIEIKELFHSWKWKKHKIKDGRFETQQSLGRSKEKSTPASADDFSVINLELGILKDKVINSSEVREKFPALDDRI